MLRSRVLALVGIIVFGLSASNLSAQDNGSGLVFTGCPPYVEGNRCDSLFYQVVAIDIGTGKKCPEAKYFIVSGLGEINEKTGLWLFHPESENLPPHYQETVEIAAYKGNDTTTSDENCFFSVRVYDKKPRFEGYCGAHMTVLFGDTIVVPLEVTDADWCHEPEITMVEIHPTPSGMFSYDSVAMTVTFVPVPDDQDQSFEVVVFGTSGPGVFGCLFWFDCFEPELFKFRLESVPVQDVRPGDTVSVDLIVDECPAYLEYIDLMVWFDNGLLSYLDAIPGAPFFDPDTGCGWSSLYCVTGYPCAGTGGRLLNLRAFAGGGVLPSTTNCYKPREVPAVLATLQFVVTDHLEPGQQFAPVDFYWCDCKDNQLWSPAHGELYSASEVMTPEGRRLKPTGMPGPSGASDECFFYGMGTVERYRNVWYRNGGIRLNRANPAPQYSVRLGILDDQLQGHFLNLPITLEAMDSAQGLGGFDFLFGYDASALAFQMALEGDLYDSCGWEYFTYRYGGYPECGDACPSGMLRVIGLADMNDGPNHPGCDEPFPGYVQPCQLPVTLAVLRFLVSNDMTLAGQFVPIRFFWYDCGDNILANHDGGEGYLSARVFDENGTIINHETAFPTYFGAPDECVNYDPSTGKFARRYVDFHNGGVQIKEAEPIDMRGDINMNGIPWEIADAMMFSNFLWTGWVHIDSGTRARLTQSADINQDGYPLTLADARLFIMIITGEASPDTVIETSSGRARVTQDKNLKELSFVTTEPVEWMMLYFSGDVMIDSTALPQGSSVKLFVYANHTSARFACGTGLDQSAGWTLTYFGDGELLDAHAVNTSCQHVVTDIAQVTPPAPYSVRLGVLDDQLQGHFSDLPITMEEIESTQGLGGFDFLFGYDASALVFQRALEGDLYDSCGWEYFTYRYSPHGDCGLACPSGMLRVVGIAETNDGPYHPGCDDPFPGYVQTEQLPIVLAYLRFLISNDRNLSCTFVPIGFFWYDCGDNVLANHDGREAYLSARVFDENDEPISEETEFPTWFGAPDECVNYDPATGKVARRYVDFHNGGIGIIGDCDIDARGDININGLPYEIADAVMFSNYFTMGLAAFGNHVEGSIAASDCNADGITLTIEDLIYLIRVVIGDAEPYLGNDPSPNVAYFNWDHTSAEVFVNTPDSLGAVYLIVEAEITPTLLADHMEMRFGWDTGWTKILVYSTEANRFLSAGSLVSIAGATGIVSVETATFDARPVTVAVDSTTGVDDPSTTLPTEFALHANYPNPFNPSTTIEYDLPSQVSVEIVVYNITGQKVRTLVNGNIGAGKHAAVWDGRDTSGSRVSSGIYIYRITAGDFVRSRKMLLLK